MINRVLMSVMAGVPVLAAVVLALWAGRGAVRASSLQ